MDTATMTSTYTPGKLLLSIVPRDQGDMVMTVAKQAGARGGTILLGHTTVESKILLALGLDSKETELVFTLLAPAEVPAVIDALTHDERMRKIREGAALCLDVSGILRHVMPGCAEPRFSANSQTELPSMSSNASHELITVIVNAGFAGDIMDAARKAGAPGGTIMSARGTGREEDVKFFGITIVPEKEFLLILAPKDKADDILEAIKRTPCLNTPGIGIAFCTDVERFIPLGKKN